MTLTRLFFSGFDLSKLISKCEAQTHSPEANNELLGPCRCEDRDFLFEIIAGLQGEGDFHAMTNLWPMRF